MPFTPYHLGPALLVALALYPLIDIPAFLLATIVLDLEPFVAILTGNKLPLHGRFHSLTLGTIVGLLVSVTVILYRRYGKPLNIKTRLDHEYTIKQTILTSIAGVWLHTLLDSFLYADLNLFYPLKWSPLLGLLQKESIQQGCIVSFILSVMVYLLRVTTIWLKEKRLTQDSVIAIPVSVKEQTSDKIVDYETSPTSGFKTNFPKGFERKQPLNEELDITPQFNEAFLTPNDYVPILQDAPEICIGAENEPLQWGIIGKSDESLVGMDLNEPHIIFVSGKQGSGKGYTIGVLTEMLLTTSIPGISNVKKPATIIVFHKPREDTRSEFWSIIHQNQNEKEIRSLFEEYNVTQGNVINASKLRIFVDPFAYVNERNKFEHEYETQVYPIGISPQRLTAEDWPYVLSIGKRSGSMYVKKIFQIIKKTQYDEDFGLRMIKSHIEASDLNPAQKSFATMRLETLQDYLEAGDFFKDLIIGGVNIFDLRKIMMEPDDVFSVMILVISAILNNEKTEREQFVFIINEAHDYLRKGLSKDFTDYISYLIRKKRHAGTWLMLDTHFPEDVDPKIIKGSDTKIFHKSDIISSNLLNQVVEGTPIPPHQLNTGQAIIRSDKSNLGPDKLLVVNIRPRITHHGGATKTAI